MDTAAPEQDPPSWNPDTEELFQLAITVATDATTRSLPIQSIKLARLEDLVKHEHGSALCHAMYSMWIEGWINVLRAAIPGIDAEGLWDQVNLYTDVPAKTLNISEYSISATCGLLGYVIDGDPTESGTDDPDLAYDGLSRFEYFNEKIFAPGVRVLVEVGVVLLFLLKTGFFEAGERGTGRPMQDPGELRF